MVRGRQSVLGFAVALCFPFLGLAAIEPKVSIELPADSPVLIVSSEVTLGARLSNGREGTDLHERLSLCNVSAKAIAGVTLRIEPGLSGPDNQAMLILPSVQAAPGAVFSARLDLQLPRRYAPKTQPPGVRIGLDAVLFRDLSIYGPDVLHSSHSLIVYELEARREHEYLGSLLAAGYLSAIREELNFGLPEEQPQLRMELAPLQLPETAGKPLRVSPVVFDRAPITLLGGGALLTETSLNGPHVLIRNDSKKRLRSVDIAFILRDERGHEAPIATFPAQLRLEPAQTRVLQQRATMVLSRTKGQPIIVRSLAAFVAEAEFDDGTTWIPSRQDIERATDSLVLRRALADCPEMERMSGIFRHTGIGGVESDLKGTPH